MLVNKFKGYIESKDITKVSPENLVYPSRNVMSTREKIVTRGGLVNDGNVATTNDPTHSEFVWKDSLGGARPIRCTGRKVQVKFEGKWYTIFESLNADVTRVIFATWVDSTGAVIKKRLFFVDGSTTLYQWNGAIAKVASYSSPTITLDITNTGVLQGFDDGSTTNQGLRVFRLDGDGALLGTEDKNYTNNPTSTTLTLASGLTDAPDAGDIVMAKPTAVADKISATFKLDAIYTYKNHVIVANYNSVELYWSHIETYSLATGLDFVQPSAGSRTALTAIYQRLDGNFTAMVARKDVLWVSDADDWYKTSKSVEQNAYGLWVDVEKFETGERKGALPMACAKYKGDIIYVAQDKTVQRVTTVEVLGRDEIQLISDEVEDLFKRLDLSDVRVYYIERALYIICPVESTMVILDLIEAYYQPPQIMPIHCMSIIGGVKYGHSNVSDETFKLFSGKQDLETEIEGVIAFPYYGGSNPLRYKEHTLFGMSCRINGDTTVSIEQMFETDGQKALQTTTVKGGEIKTYTIDDDVSWATHPYADRSWGGADMESKELKRAFVFDKNDAIGWFEYRPVFTIRGGYNEFHLLSWSIDDKKSDTKIGQDLFVPR